MDFARSISPMGVPTPQYDILEGWDAPFAPRETFPQLHEKWETENGSRFGWIDEGFERLLADLRRKEPPSEGEG